MPYRVRISDDAFKHVKSPLPADVLADLKQAIERFAESPTQLSRPSTFPFVPGEQEFSHVCTFPPFKYWFRLAFKYAQDEETLLIAHVGVVVYDLHNTGQDPPDVTKWTE